MTRTTDILLLLLYSLTPGFWILLALIGLALVASLGSATAHPIRRPIFRRAAAGSSLLVTWGIGFVISTAYLLSTPIVETVPLGEVKLYPPADSGYEAVRIEYRGNDVHMWSGIHIECVVEFYPGREGQLSLQAFQGIHEGGSHVVLDRTQIEETLAMMDVEINRPQVATQIDQLALFIRNLGRYGMAPSGLKAFQQELHLDWEGDKRIPTWILLAWVGLWIVVLFWGATWATGLSWHTLKNPTRTTEQA